MLRRYWSADSASEAEQNKNKGVHLWEQSRDLEGDEVKLWELQGSGSVEIHKQKYEIGKCNPSQLLSLVRLK